MAKGVRVCAGVARCRLPHVSDCRESEGGWKKKICSGIRLDCGITMVSDKTRSNKLKRYKASDNREFNREFMDLVLFQSSNWLKSFERTQCASSIFFFFYERLQRLLERKRDYRRRSKKSVQVITGVYVSNRYLGRGC